MKIQYIFVLIVMGLLFLGCINQTSNRHAVEMGVTKINKDTISGVTVDKNLTKENIFVTTNNLDNSKEFDKYNISKKLSDFVMFGNNDSQVDCSIEENENERKAFIYFALPSKWIPSINEGFSELIEYQYMNLGCKKEKVFLEISIKKGSDYILNTSLTNCKELMPTESSGIAFMPLMQKIKFNSTGLHTIKINLVNCEDEFVLSSSEIIIDVGNINSEFYNKCYLIE